MPTNDNVVSLGNFLGIRNTLRSRRLPKGALSQADNIDVFDDGSIELREGHTQSAAFTSITAAFATEDGHKAYIVDNGDLKELNPDISSVIIKSGIPAGDIFWAEAGDRVYFSGAAKGVILRHEFVEWGVPAPTQPAVLLVPGTLPAGEYNVTYVYVTASGEQGPAATPIKVAVDGSQALTVTVDVLVGYEALLFFTSTDKNIFYRFVKTADATTLWDGPVSSLAHPIDKAQLYSSTTPMFGPIEFHLNRMWGVQYFPEQDLSYVFSSQPFWYGIFDVFSNFAVVHGEVFDMESVRSGLIVATNVSVSIIIVSEDDDIRSEELLEYGVPKGKSIYKKEDGSVFIWTNRGMVTGPPFKNVTEEKFSLAPGNTCYVNGVKQNGADRVLVLVDDQGGQFNQY